MAKRRRSRRRVSARERELRSYDRNPLYNPARQLAGRHLKLSVDRLADMQVRPQLSALDREAATATTQGAALSKNAGDYYRQLAEREAQSIAQQQALTARTRGALGAIANETQGQISQAEGSEKARLAADAATRGAGLDGGTSALAALAASRSRAAQGAQAFRSTGEMQGANYEGLAMSNRTARGLRGGEIQGQLANKLGNTLGTIRSKRTEAEASRGDIATKLLMDLRQSGFENLATVRGLDLKQADLDADVQKSIADQSLASRKLASADRHNRALERISQINSEISAGRLSESQRHNLETEKQGLLKITDGGKGAKSALTPSKRLAYKDSWEGYVGAIRTGQKPPSGVKPLLAKAATEYERNRKRYGRGFVSSATRRRIRKRYGFSIPGRPSGKRKTILGVPNAGPGGLA